MTRNGAKTAPRAEKVVAHTTYIERKKAVTTRMNRLREALKKHHKAEQADPKDWGFAGDLGRVSLQLDEILESFNS